MYGTNYGFYNPTRMIPNQYGQPQTYQQPMVGTQMSLPSGLQGKIVDSVDVVKSMDIPLDGSVSYFPLTDNSCIVTKKLGINGTSEISIYKPVLEDKKEEKVDVLDEILTEIRSLKANMEELTKPTKEE